MNNEIYKIQLKRAQVGDIAEQHYLAYGEPFVYASTDANNETTFRLYIGDGTSSLQTLINNNREVGRKPQSSEIINSINDAPASQKINANKIQFDSNPMNYNLSLDSTISENDSSQSFRNILVTGKTVNVQTGEEKTIISNTVKESIVTTAVLKNGRIGVNSYQEVSGSGIPLSEIFEPDETGNITSSVKKSIQSEHSLESETANIAEQARQLSPEIRKHIWDANYEKPAVEDEDNPWHWYNPHRDVEGKTNVLKTYVYIGGGIGQFSVVAKDLPINPDNIKLGTSIVLYLGIACKLFAQDTYDNYRTITPVTLIVGAASKPDDSPLQALYTMAITIDGINTANVILRLSYEDERYYPEVGMLASEDIMSQQPLAIRILGYDIYKTPDMPISQ